MERVKNAVMIEMVFFLLDHEMEELLIVMFLVLILHLGIIISVIFCLKYIVAKHLVVQVEIVIVTMS